MSEDEFIIFFSRIKHLNILQNMEHSKEPVILEQWI